MNNLTFTLGFSPCPNDTFIFDALVNHKIDTQGINFNVMLEDVQTLNQWALNEKLDFSKVSYGVWPLLKSKYDLLDSGGALGKGVGPLLIAKKEIPLTEIDRLYIAIPGANTTAHMLFSLAFPNAKNKQFKIFNEIEDAVLNGVVDAGVIIHENRFTYQQKGLFKLIDLGNFWEEETKSPIPLGGIVAKKNLPVEIKQTVDGLIRRSVKYAFGHHHVRLSNYVVQHAQEMNPAVMKQHINLYVNQYSIALGEEGKKAVEKLEEVYKQLHN